ncbi:unnamed protein product [Hydatigera taeniaeformis]|uniref:Ig-like domain-containing protein n=1 Tax=Hydatigena taeniaeformis TaxID=6205 RepID=A0A0R3WUF7_HYDTA|nr:unnamed protein product [Hydatigera taeniaeformis]
MLLAINQVGYKAPQFFRVAINKVVENGIAFIRKLEHIATTGSPVPPKMAPIQVSRITLPSSGGLSSARSTDVHANTGTGGGVDLATQSPQIYGLGTRTNPYDLRSGVELHLICQTDCGYPRALPEWTVNNMVRLFT